MPADFIKEEALPEFIVVVGVLVVGLALWRGDVKMLADVCFRVSF